MTTLDPLRIIVERLNTRREALGMTHDALARRSGVPIATTKRILGGRAGKASLSNVLAVAKALGLRLGLGESSVANMLEERAREKAGEIAGARGEASVEAVEHIARELVAGSRRVLWAE